MTIEITTTQAPFQVVSDAFIDLPSMSIRSVPVAIELLAALPAMYRQLIQFTLVRVPS